MGLDKGDEWRSHLLGSGELYRKREQSACSSGVSVTSQIVLSCWVEIVTSE